MTQHFSEKIKERKKSGTKRALTIKQNLSDFVSNDYLGLARSRELFDQINEYDFGKIVNLNGSTGSRLLSGNSVHAENLEHKLADIFKSEACLLFNSGYVANLAMMASLPQRGDTILYDSLSHVCIKEGAWLSKAQCFSFRHNDCHDLETKLKSARGNKYIAIESVYSMNGDFAQFDDMIGLANKYDAYLLCDEAHGTGIFGKSGSGKLCELGVEQNFEARIYTFGKAMGVHGACVCGSKKLIDYLVNFARPFVYSTALPIHTIFSIDAAFEFLEKNIELQKVIREKINLFKTAFKENIRTEYRITKLDSDTPIQPLIVEGNQRAKEAAALLQSGGFDARAILSPTVKEGSERLRICLHTFNSNDEIRRLIKTLAHI